MKKIAFVFILLWAWSGILIAQQISGTAGKIWYTDDLVYINVQQKGVLIINNQNPRQPHKVGFVEIAGNVDLAVMGNLLYADSHADLVVYDVGNPAQPKEVNRIKNVFPTYTQQVTANNNRTSRNTQQSVNLGGNKEVNAFLNTWNNVLGKNQSGNNMGITGIQTNAQPNTQTTASTSKGGSMARFALGNGYLYSVDESSIQVFSLDNPISPRQMNNRIYIGNNIETIFCYDNKVFIGSQQGMYIYGLQNPQYPHYLGQYRHTRSCDPVVVEGKYAYVTMRNGTDCKGNVNQLDVIDISDCESPKKVKTYPMTNPHGLGIDNGTLFICDGADGLKVFDASNPNTIDKNRLAHFSAISAYDVIPVASKKLLLMINSGKLLQYDYSNPKNVSLLSELQLFVYH